MLQAPPERDGHQDASRRPDEVHLQDRVQGRALREDEEEGARDTEKGGEARISAGKDPMGLAAAALYVSCTLEGEDKTQRDVAEAAGVTEVTIRNRYKGLRSALGI